MFKKVAITLLVLILFVAAFLISAYVAGRIATPVQNIPLNVETGAQTPTKKLATASSSVLIKEPSAATSVGIVLVGGVEYEASVQTGKTAHDLMEAARAEGLSFETEFYSGLGFFVTSIGGVQNDPGGGRYWTLYINDERSNLGASNYILKGGDLIEWKLEKN